MSMTVSIQAAKQQLREKMKARREVLTEKEYLELSSRVCDRLESLPFFIEAKTIAAYYPVHNEVDILLLLKKSIKNRKRILLPRISIQSKVSLDFVEVTDLELKIGPYGIPQPSSAAVNIPLSEIDILLIPGLVFDHQHRRVGYGKGYYDRLLKKLSAKTKTIGVSFSFQIVESLPQNSFDRPVEIVVTEKQVF
jgi:5-formyltetrahydrofolate cyclo-ligase